MISASRLIVDAALLVDVGDLEVEAPLAGADLADALEQFVEVVLAEARALLEPFVVEHEALDDELPERLRGPDAELRGLAAVDAVADGDDGVEVVVVDRPRDVSRAFSLNSPIFRTVASRESSPLRRCCLRWSLIVCLRRPEQLRHSR